MGWRTICSRQAWRTRRIHDIDFTSIGRRRSQILSEYAWHAELATSGNTIQCHDLMRLQRKYTTEYRSAYWSYWWLYEPSESTGSEPVIYRTRSFPFFTVYHHVDILGLNELLFSFPPVLELQHSFVLRNSDICSDLVAPENRIWPFEALAQYKKQ